MAKMESYCKKCNRNVELDDCRQVSVEKNKKLFSGTCPACGTKIMHEIDLISKEI